MNTKTVWIFGGAGYLGAPISEALDRCCAKVVCFDLPGRAGALVREKSLSRTVACDLDIAQTESLEASLDAVIAQEGIPDGMVNLTAASSSGIRLPDLSADDFQKTITRALTSSFVLGRFLGEKMKTNGGGSIVSYSSMYGLVSPDPRIYRAPMAPNPIDYGASKAAIIQMTRYFAVHYGPDNVRFNALAPGPFPNPNIQRDHPDFIKDLEQKTPMHRVGRSEEMVAPTLFLLGDGASYVTGQCLAVDGGWTAW